MENWLQSTAKSHHKSHRYWRGPREPPPISACHMQVPDPRTNLVTFWRRVKKKKKPLRVEESIERFSLERTSLFQPLVKRPIFLDLQYKTCNSTLGSWGQNYLNGNLAFYTYLSRSYSSSPVFPGEWQSAKIGTSLSPFWNSGASDASDGKKAIKMVRQHQIGCEVYYG